MAFLPNLCACPVKCGAYFSGVMLKKQSSEYKLYACGYFFRMPLRGVGSPGRRFDIEQKSSFLDEHQLKFCNKKFLFLRVSESCF
jgi:hypothetical protein